MLDIPDDSPPVAQRHASIAGINAGVTPAKPVRSMLDVTSPLPKPASPPARSAQTSPTDSLHKNQAASKLSPRSLSDAGSRPADFGPRSNARSNPTTDYQFSGFLPSNAGASVIPKRNTQGGKRTISSAMSEVARGVDLSGFGALDNGHRHSSKSRSPHNRLSLRSASPHADLLSANQITLDDGRVIDLNHAYRRLSGANLALTGTSLSTLGGKGRKASTEDSVSSENARLEKDYNDIEGEGVVEDSSDEFNSSDEEHRGRKKESRRDDGPEGSTLGMGRAKGPRTARSLMAAAEEERMCISTLISYFIGS